MKETRTGMYPTGWNAAPPPNEETSSLHTVRASGQKLYGKLAHRAIARAWWEGQSPINSYCTRAMWCGNV